MLDDRDREALDELERRLTADDPAFGQSFAARARRLDHRRPGTPVAIIATGAVLLAGLMLAAGSVVGAVAVVIAAVLVWLAWRSGSDAPSPHP